VILIILSQKRAMKSWFNNPKSFSVLYSGNGVICQQSYLSYLITQKTQYMDIYKSKFVIHWTVNWPYLLSASRYQAEIFTQDRYEPGASFKL